MILRGQTDGMRLRRCGSRGPPTLLARFAKELRRVGGLNSAVAAPTGVRGRDTVRVDF